MYKSTNVNIMRSTGHFRQLIAAALLVMFVLGPALPMGTASSGGHGDITRSLMPPQDPKAMGRGPVYTIPKNPSARAMEPRATGTAKVVIIPVQFNDVHAWSTSTVDAIFNKSLSDSPLDRSMNDYFKEASLGKLNLTGEVSPWVNSSHNMSYFGADGQSIDDLNGPIYRLVTEAVIQADPYIDFSKYDSDGDGVVDHIFIVHAGAAQEGLGGAKNDIWSHHWAVLDANLSKDGVQPLTVDGVKVYMYSMVSEFSPVGTWAHEFGHDHGLPDLYDIDGTSYGVGKWDVMGTGSWNGGGKYPAHPSAWSKAKLGWLTPVEVVGPMANMTMDRVETGGLAYRLSIGDPAQSKEYFLLEDRQRVGFDEKLPGDGLLIWHVDDAQTSNTEDEHRLVDLEEADEATGGDNPVNPTDPWANSTAGFWQYSVPTSDSYNGLPSGWSITYIGPSGPQMTLTIGIIANDVGVAFLAFDRYVPENVAATIDAHVFNFGTKGQSNVLVVTVVTQGSTVVDTVNKTIPALKSKTETVVTFTFTPSVQGNYIISVKTVLASDQVPENDESVEVLHATTIIFMDDVEKGENGWKHYSNRPPSDICKIVDDSGGTSAVESPHHAWFCGVGDRSGGNYVPMSDYYIERTLDMKLVKTGFLILGHREDLTLSIQNKSIPRSDTAFVEVKTNLDTTYTVLDQYSGTSGGWSTNIYDMSSLLGRVGVINITVRFHLQTQFLGYNKGWWIDDILIVGQWSERDVAVVLNKTLMSARPGGSYSLTVTVWNSGSASDTYALKVYAPPYWEASLPMEDITVEALESRSMTLTFKVYAKALASEEDNVQVEATSKEDSAVSTTAKALVIIERMSGLSVADVPVATVLPGSQHTFLVNITNKGNGKETVQLALSGDQKDWANLSRLSVDLAPFETLGVDVVVIVPFKVKAGTTADIEVKAWTSGGLKDSGSIGLSVGRSYGVVLTVVKGAPPVTPGDSVDLTLNVTNNGNGDDIIDIEYITPPGWTVDGDKKESIGPWQSVTLLLTVTVPDSSPLSGFTVKVRATSPAGKVVEEVGIDVEVVLPDPAIASMELSKTYLSSPGNVTVTAVIENKGTGTVTEVLVSFYDGGKAFQTVMVDNLTKGSSRTVTVSRKFGSGLHDVSVILTYDGRQSDKTNDEAHDSLKVKETSGFIPGPGAGPIMVVLAAVALAVAWKRKIRL